MAGLQVADYGEVAGSLIGFDWNSTDDRSEKVFEKLFPIENFIPDETDLGFDASDTPPTDAEPPERKREGVPEPLDTSITEQQRITFFTRTYCATKFDTEPRPQWTRPEAANDNHKHKHSWPARDEATNNALMVGDTAAETEWLNGQAFGILETICSLVDATTPTSDWIKHNGHGAENRPESEDNSGYGGDMIHDYGPSPKKIKRLYELDAEPAPIGQPWNPGPSVMVSKETIPDPDTGLVKTVKCLRDVGGLRFNLFSHMTAFHAKTRWLRFQTKTRKLKGAALRTKTQRLKGTRADTFRPDPADTSMYTGAALPRNENGELETPFFAGRVRSSNSALPDTSHYWPGAGPTHSFADPYVANIIAETAREEANIRLSQYSLVSGGDPYEALIDAACGFRMSEYCGGVEGDKRDSARGRSLLRTAIGRIIEDRASADPKTTPPETGLFAGF